MSHPQSYEILLFPEHEESGTGTHAPGTAIRSGVVAATGETGASGYPRYTGDGMKADIDPSTHTVEALLVDGAELDYGLTVRIAEHIGGTRQAGGDAEAEWKPETAEHPGTGTETETETAAEAEGAGEGAAPPSAERPGAG